jgi:predicted nucleic acid-binding protein
MGAYFLDTSSLVKRYHQESGTEIVDQLFEESEHRLIISDISIIEFYSAIGLKVRTGEVKSTAFSTLRKLFSNPTSASIAYKHSNTNAFCRSLVTNSLSARSFSA